MCEARDKALPNRIGNERKHYGYCTGFLLHRSQGWRAKRYDDIRGHADKRRRGTLELSGAGDSEPSVNPDRVIPPSQLLQLLAKRCNERLHFQFGEIRQYCDAPRHRRLLRVRSQRPCNGCTSNDFDEIAAPHLPAPRLRKYASND